MEPRTMSRILDANLPYYGFSHLAMMEAAGKAFADQVPKTVKNVDIFCGLGNNGGDGLVIARHLSDRCAVRVIIAGNTLQFKTPEARKNWEILRYNEKIECIEITDSSKVKNLKQGSRELIIDALLGAGGKDLPQEPIASLIRWINKSSIPVFSVDLPSGWDTELSCRTTKTYSFHNKKTPSAEVLPIGIPKEYSYYTGPGNVKYLAKRNALEHKGQFGHIAVIAGSAKYHGAPLYGALAAAKFVDLVSIFTSKENISAIKKLGPELIVQPYESADNLERFSSILIGPGTEPDQFSKKLIDTALKANIPCVLDAGALRLGNKNKIHSKCILTPHRNEYKSFFGEDASEENMMKNAKNGIILLKGPVDWICDGKNVYKNFSGNMNMAVGGTGDVLAGLCAAFAANNSLLESALAAAFLNGAAGDLMKGAPFSASDLLERLREAYQHCQ